MTVDDSNFSTYVVYFALFHSPTWTGSKQDLKLVSFNQDHPPLVANFL